MGSHSKSDMLYSIRHFLTNWLNLIKYIIKYKDPHFRAVVENISLDLRVCWWNIMTHRCDDQTTQILSIGLHNVFRIRFDLSSNNIQSLLPRLKSLLWESGLPNSLLSFLPGITTCYEGDIILTWHDINIRIYTNFVFHDENRYILYKMFNFF